MTNAKAGWGCREEIDVAASKRSMNILGPRGGFTLIELLIVVVVIGILVALAIPNFTDMQDRAREASTKSNAHTVQLAVEDHAILSDGVYSVAAADIQPHLPGQGLLANVFTGATSEPQWGSPAGDVGQIGLQLVIQNGVPTGYSITAQGRNGIIITLENGD